jgi:hypothetical protein
LLHEADVPACPISAQFLKGGSDQAGREDHQGLEERRSRRNRAPALHVHEWRVFEFPHGLLAAAQRFQPLQDAYLRLQANAQRHRVDE